VWLWALYDFANSLAFVNVLLYFGLWFISEHQGSDAWISASVAVTTLVMLFTLPVLGNMSDRMQKRIPFLAVCSFLCIVSLILLGYAMGGIVQFTFMSATIVIVLYSCFNFFYNSSFTFYNAFLPEFLSNGKSMERTSGLGMGMGQLGNVVGLVLAIPLAQGKISVLGFSGTPLIFIFSGLLFLLCSLPVFLFLKDRPHVTESVKLGRSLRETFHDLRHIRDHPDVFWYLITYCLFADAMLTLSLFVSSYLDIVAKMPDTQKSITFILVVVAGLFGSIISPVFVRLFGSRKRANSACIAFWAILIVLFAVTTHPWMFSFIVILNGFAFGALFSLSRAFFSHLVPVDKQAEMFGLYALFERTASVFGPLIWSGTAVVFASFGDDRYRFSVVALAVLVLISFFTMQKVKDLHSL
jgi:UMF1 family MFS transporter